MGMMFHKEISVKLYFLLLEQEFDFIWNIKNVQEAK